MYPCFYSTADLGSRCSAFCGVSRIPILMPLLKALHLLLSLLSPPHPILQRFLQLFILSARPYLLLHNIVKSIIEDKEGPIKPFYYTFSDGGIFGFYASGHAELASGVLLVHNSLTISFFDTTTHSIAHTISMSSLYISNLL
jgi:hypothetical protein